ncbi:hypothetical protein SNE40_013426 [Patella caerulea]|uniref:SMB domain-containing protein n=1 Tax=Patella caerulea TaxID=87958 RepID=A0AAN8JI83_PATCE
MGKISLFFTFALLLYLIGKIVTDERVGDILTTLPRDVDRETVTTSATIVDRGTVTISTTGVDRDTVTTLATDVDRGRVTTLATDVDKDTVTTLATDVDRDTVTASATDTVTTLARDIGRGMVTTLARDIGRGMVTTLATDVDRDTITTPSSGDLNSCPEFVMVSCNQQCGVYRPLPCSCDQFCLIYKNCCPDYEMVCAREAEIIREYYSDLLEVDITCLESPTLDTDLGLQVISGCPVQACEESKRLCNLAITKPVTLGNTTLHFINIHCLICNGFNPSDVTQWNLQIVPKKIEGDLVTGGFENLIQSGQFSVYPLSTPGLNLTYCCNTIIDHCEVPTTMEDKCSSSHSFFLKYGSKRKYCLKNHFCADCNKNLYPDVCLWSNMDFAVMKMKPRMAFLIEMGIKGSVSVKSYGTRNQMFWSSAECKSPINREFGVVITDCTLQECRQNIQLTDGKCLLNNKIFCFVIIANLSLIDQDINIDKLSGLLSQQAMVSLSQMNFTLGSFNTTYNKRDQLLLCDLQFVNETCEVNAFQFLEIYRPSVDMRLSKTGLSGNISFCAEINLLACSDSPQCAVYHSLEISPRPSLNKGSSKLIGNHALAIVIFMAAIIVR